MVIFEPTFLSRRGESCPFPVKHRSDPEFCPALRRAIRRRWAQLAQQ
jgi:hypothetical protein